MLYALSQIVYQPFRIPLKGALRMDRLVIRTTSKIADLISFASSPSILTIIPESYGSTDAPAVTSLLFDIVEVMLLDWT
jgi:hypothetical protein